MRKILTKLLLLFTLVTLTLSLATACGGNPFINPEGGNEVGSAGKYVVNVLSEGGLKLNGVKVTASKNGEVVKQAISQKGQAILNIDPDVYQLSFEDLPAGYYAEEGIVYQTEADVFDITVTFASKVISSAATSGTVYRVGDVMHDFSWKDANNTRYVLSELLEEYQAVMLNFWFKDCSPCRAEFPAIESAYAGYTDKIKILALSHQDSVSQILAFQEELGLTFPMGQDTGNIRGFFNVSSFPTTVIIDRYGVVGFMESGSIPEEATWKALFSKYTADDYTQTPGDDDEGGKEEGSAQQAKPNIANPDVSVYAAINGEGFTGTYSHETNPNDAEYSWPWIVKTENNVSYISASNVGKDNSFSILYVTFEAKFGDILSFEYNVVSEEGFDVLYVLMNGELVSAYSGNTEGWKKAEAVHIFDRNQTVELAFTFFKDEGTTANKEFAGIRNLSLTTNYNESTPMDVRRECAIEPNEDNTKFNTYVETMLGDDGYYHVKNADGSQGAIILAEYIDVAPWTTLRYGRDTIENNTEYNTSYYRTPYFFAYWEFGDEPGSSNFIFKGNDYNDCVIDYYYMDMFSDNGYIPVSQEVKNMLQDFAEDFASRKNQPIYDEMWLEFCYYFDHYGNEHDKCSVTNDPVKGMSIRNAFKIDANKTNVDDGIVIEADIYRPIQIKPGVRFEFTAPKSGTYSIRSLVENSSTDPLLYIYNTNAEVIYEQDETKDYKRFVRQTYYNFEAYIYLEEGQTIYPTPTMKFPGDTGKYNFEIKYVGESFKTLEFCTTGEGLWTDPDLTGDYIYLAIDVTYSSRDGYYREITKNLELGSPIYIDFIHPNFFDTNGHTLYEMIVNGEFDFSDIAGEADYTAEMLAYYNQAISVDESDELYGLALATQDLVNIVDKLTSRMYNEGPSKNSWRSLAVYYNYYGPENLSPWN